jgi:hypothetical protein
MARQDFNLANAPYLLTHADGQKSLQQRWVVEGGLTVAQVKATIVPNLFARYNALSWTDNEIMLMSVLPAYWNDAVISGQGGGQSVSQVVTSNNGITVPAGVYRVNYPCIVDGGEYYGQGTGFAGTVGGTVSMATNLVYDKTTWLGGLGSGSTHLDGTYSSGGNTINIIYDSANLIVTSTWQVLSGARSYTEGGVIDGFRLTGDNGDWYDVASRRSNGFGGWDLGECWRVGRLFCETFNGSGVVLVRSTPATISQLSSFQNAWSGIELVGSELNTVNIDTLSGDDNPCLVGMSAGYGRGAGGVLNVNLSKSESGKRTPNKAQILLWQRDASYGLVNFSDAQCDMNNLFLDSLIVLKSNAAAAGQVVHAQIRGWNCRTLVHDITNGVRWPAQSYRPERITYSYRNGQSTLFDECTGQVLTSSPVNATDRLGFVANNGTFNYVNGTPLYDIYGGGQPPPPPPQCSWITGAYGWNGVTDAFSNCGEVTPGKRTQTRTVVSSVPGCVPQGAMPSTTYEEDCNVPPPPVLPLFTRTPFNNASASTSIDIPNVAGVKRITLTNFTLTDVPNYQRICAELPPVGSNAQGVRLKPSGNGGIFTGPNGIAISMSTSPIVRNVNYPTLTLILATAITVDRLFGLPGTGSAIQITCDRVDFYAS